MKLYLDDVEEIADSFKGISGKVMISTDKYSVDAVSELSEIHHIEELTIWSDLPYLGLMITRHYVSLRSVGSSSTQMRGVASKIGEILKSRARLYPVSLLSTAPPYLTGGVLGLLLPLGLISIEVGFMNKQLWLFSLGSAATVLGMVMVYLIFGLGSRIISKKRSAEESFWERNKDTLVVSTIMLFLGALLTFLGQLAWKLLIGP